MRRAAVILTIAVASCGAQRDGEAPPRCTPPMPVPAGFRVTAVFADPYPDRIASRTSLEGPGGRLLHRFAGVPGEIGEGLRPVGDVALAGGGSARLLGRGRVWAAVWSVDGPCGERAVLGAGFRRRGFLAVLRRAGLLA